CEQILRDEKEHVRFQSERLAILRRGCSVVGIAGRHALQRFLFLGTSLVVYAGHRRALRAGGFGFVKFWRSCWEEFGDALRRMNPRAYRWQAGLKSPLVLEMSGQAS